MTQTTTSKKVKWTAPDHWADAGMVYISAVIDETRTTYTIEHDGTYLEIPCIDCEELTA